VTIHAVTQVPGVDPGADRELAQVTGSLETVSFNVLGEAAEAGFGRTARTTEAGNRVSRGTVNRSSRSLPTFSLLTENIAES